MPRAILLYYITDRNAFPGDERTRRMALLAKIAEAARAGVDYIQLREKDLPARDLEALASDALSAIRDARPATGNRQLATAFLINSRTDLAIAVGSYGVHLPANDITPGEVRRIWDAAPCGADTLARVTISVSCHDPTEVHQAEIAGADLAVFAPVFEKKDAPGVNPAGLDALRQACQHHIPVVALGGITLENAAPCLDAGAAGIAGIRLFQENDVAEIVRHLWA